MLYSLSQSKAPEWTDEDLIEKVKKGESDAFNLLVRRYQNKVFSLIFRMVHMPNETEDLAQEVFLTLYRSLPQFRGECAFSSWVYKVTINLCKNRLKFLQRRDFYRSEEISEINEKNAKFNTSILFSNPEQQVIGKQIEEIFQQKLNELDEEAKVVIILRDVEHFTYEEIAEIVQLPVGTVKSRLHRARATLKCKLEPFLQ